MTDAEPADALYPIRTVSTLTGVHPVTLRAWERRYGLIRPHRTPKGHRLYTRADVDILAGRHTVASYVLRPVRKLRDNALRQ